MSQILFTEPVDSRWHLSDIKLSDDGPFYDRHSDDRDYDLFRMREDVVAKLHLQTWDHELLPRAINQEGYMRRLLLIVAPGFHFICHMFGDGCTALVDAYGIEDVDQRIIISTVTLKMFDGATIFQHQPTITFGFKRGNYVSFSVKPFTFDYTLTVIDILTQRLFRSFAAPKVMVTPRGTGRRTYDVVSYLAEGAYIAVHSTDEKTEFGIFSRCSELNSETILAYFSGATIYRFLSRDL